MFSVLVIRLRSLRLLRVSGIVMRLRMFLLRSEERFSRNAETDLVCRLLLEKKKKAAHAAPDAPNPPLRREGRRSVCLGKGRGVLSSLHRSGGGGGRLAHR